MKRHLDLKQNPADGDGNGDGEPIGPQVQTAPRLDLRQLAVHRGAGPSGEKPARSPRRRLSLLTRYVLPGGLLLGFVGLIGWSARASLLPSRAVTVMPVLSARAEVRQAGTPLFQCAGWVEPRPTPIVVPALAEGVVERLLVVEGQVVKAGEPVAYLIDVDAKLTLQGAEAELRLREADLAKARANSTSARSRNKYPVHLEAPLSEAEAALAKVQTELGSLPAKLAAAEAHLRFARLDLDGKTAAKAALSQRAVDLAQSELETATAVVQEIQTRKGRLEAETAALSARRDTLKQQLDLKIDETRDVDTGEANVKAAEAIVCQAQNAVDTAKLRLERMVIRAPQDGRVLKLVARPGLRVSGLARDALQESSTVVMLYDPKMLQLRTDVPLDQVPRVRPGQPVKIETEAVPGGLEGEVLFKTAYTDLQKNTLDVKVAIKDAPADLRPDMLARCTYLAAPEPGSDKKASEQLRLLVPKPLVESCEGGSRVWVADQAAGLARARTVKIGEQTGRGDLVEVLEGLGEVDKIIVGGREGLKEGERITVTGEDMTQGVEATTQRGPSKKIKRIIAGENAVK
jgi:RND family efflux transporter MFP subunit